MNITITEQKIGFVGYKPASYPKWNAKIYKNTVQNKEDWSGLYIAENKEVAKEYLPDMVINGAGKAFVHQVFVNDDVSVITCLDEGFKSGDIDMNALKKALREKGIDIQNEEFLIPKLGVLGYFFRCYNNQYGDIELIVPNSLATHISMQQFKACTLKNYQIKSCEITQKF